MKILVTKLPFSCSNALLLRLVFLLYLFLNIYINWGRILATTIIPPSKVFWGNRKSVFLAGTIDNGASIDWQSEVESELSDLDIVILNPRRDQWDSDWEQTIKNEQFKEQVEWELNGLDKVDQILIFFAANSKSPISLLELGLHASNNNLIIVCENGFWRRWNIEVVANRYNIPLYDNLSDGIELLKSKLI